MGALVDVINKTVAELEELSDRSRLGPTCLAALRAWTNGCVEWGLRFDRYSRFVPIDSGSVEIRYSAAS